MMGKFSLLVLTMVVMSHFTVLNVRAENSSNSVAQRAGGDAMERQDLRVLFPHFEILAREKASSFGNNAEDHANIELDKLSESHSYATAPEVLFAPNSIVVGNADDAYTTFERATRSIDGPNRTPNERKRKSLAAKLLADREDKDYTFVANPFVGHRSQQQLQLAQKLRDIIAADGQASRLGNGQHRGYPDLQQLSQSAKWRSLDSSNGDNNMPTYREKRRRCKVDQNLGVKNPSFCDTDAYFGAADYSMRDVWDSAGRRR